MKITTLCFLKREGEVLLAMKKRGFGEGKFNGVGGKVEVGESALLAAIRETKEEIGVLLEERHAVYTARLAFSFENRPEWNQDCFVFLADSWKNEPVETEEMSPRWFSTKKLPFEHMWVDDRHWLPKVLSGKKIRARFHFDAEGREIKSAEVKEYKDLDLSEVL